MSRNLEQDAWSALPIIGYVDLSGRGRQLAIHAGSEPIPFLGRIERLAELVDRSKATDLVVAMPDRPAARVGPQLDCIGRGPVRVHWLDRSGHRSPLPLHRRLQPSTPRRRNRPRPGAIAKRLLDALLATVGLLLISPLFLFLIALIYFTSGRPIFYLQERVGQGGRRFHIIKFRSMKPDAEGQTGPIWACNHDERCTPIGDWLRNTCLDELPQLLNIIKGDMSLVGPRPERPVFVEQFRSEIADYDLRHSVPVGLTGWAQVHGWRGRTSLRKRLQYDLDYIQRWSFWLDIRILIMTVSHVLWGRVDWGETKNRRIEREPTDALGRDTHLSGPETSPDVP